MASSSMITVHVAAGPFSRAIKMTVIFVTCFSKLLNDSFLL